MRILLHGPQGSGKSSWGVGFINSMFKADWPEVAEMLMDVDAPKHFIYTTNDRHTADPREFDMVISIQALETMRDNVILVNRKEEFNDDVGKRVEEMGVELKDLATASVVIALTKAEGEKTKLSPNAFGSAQDIGQALHEGMQTLGKNEPSVMNAMMMRAMLDRLSD